MVQYSRRELGWALSKSRTTNITTQVLAAAIKNRGYPREIIFHTDRGVEFTGLEFQRILSKYDFKHCVNRIGHCTDNAFMESFCYSLKGELTRKTKFASLAHLRKEIGRYIKQFYNNIRLHSGLNFHVTDKVRTKPSTTIALSILSGEDHVVSTKRSYEQSQHYHLST